MSDGVKYDTGKPLVGTLCRIFPNALLEVGKCIEFGTSYKQLVLLLLLYHLMLLMLDSFLDRI